MPLANGNVPYKVGNEVEMDEKYVPYSHKGRKIDGVKPKLRGGSASQRGLSSEQVCIMTAIERFGNTIAKALNYAKPTSQTILKFGECLEYYSYVMVDGNTGYNELLNTKHCVHKVLKTHKMYDNFNHLNTVNSFHQLVESKLQKYRGVSSKYINRYNSLFVIQRETQDMDKIEKLQYVLLKLKKLYKITTLKSMKSEWLFA